MSELKAKLESELKSLIEKKDGLISELQKIEQAKSTATAQVIACNGAIQTLEKLLKDGE